MNKPDIQRYKYGYTDDGWGQRYLSLIEDAEGSVVRFSDHEAAMELNAVNRVAALRRHKAERNELLGLLRRLAHAEGLTKYGEALNDAREYLSKHPTNGAPQ